MSQVTTPPGRSSPANKRRRPSTMPVVNPSTSGPLLLLRWSCDGFFRLSALKAAGIRSATIRSTSEPESQASRSLPSTNFQTVTPRPPKHTNRSASPSASRSAIGPHTSSRPRCSGFTRSSQPHPGLLEPSFANTPRSRVRVPAFTESLNVAPSRCSPSLAVASHCTPPCSHATTASGWRRAKTGHGLM